MISSMVRNAINDSAIRREIRDTVCQFDDILIARIKEGLREPLPTLSASAIQHETQQRISKLHAKDIEKK